MDLVWHVDDQQHFLAVWRKVGFPQSLSSLTMDGNLLGWILLVLNSKLTMRLSECSKWKPYFISKFARFNQPSWIFAIPVSLFSFANRLTHIKENHKFQKNGKEGHRLEDPAMGLRHLVTEIKDAYALKYEVFRSVPSVLYFIGTC